MCWTFSGFPPGSWQRNDLIEAVIWELCYCFRPVVQERGSYAQANEDIVQDTKEKLLTISDSPNFAEMACEELFQRYVVALLPEGYLTNRDILDFMPGWPLTREEVGQHLSYSYGNDEFWEFDWSRGPGFLIKKCLDIHYKNPFAWWVPRAPRATKAARPARPARSARSARPARAARVPKAAMAGEG